MNFQFTDEMTSRIASCVLCWLATADADGIPNVSPKEMFLPYGENSLLIANIASPVTAKNIGLNPNVCVSMVDVFAQKGFKFTGTARIVGRHDAEYAHVHGTLTQKFGSRFSIPSVIVVTVTAAAPIIAPSYRFFPKETTEQRQIDQAMERYGVRSR